MFFLLQQEFCLSCNLPNFLSQFEERYFILLKPPPEGADLL